MKQVDAEIEVNVEALKLKLLERKRMKTRFKLLMTHQQAFDMITASYMAEVEFRHGRFVDDVDSFSHISEMAKWLTDEDPKFGMMLCGTCGNGKSTMIRSIQSLISFLCRHDRNEDQLYLKVVDAKDLVDMAKNDYPGYKKVRSCQMLAIDDLGIEPAEVLDYGNALNPAIDLINYRYNEQMFTIVSTNLLPKQLREHYGDRIADRFSEMMDRIVFTNDSYRIRKDE